MAERKQEICDTIMDLTERSKSIIIESYTFTNENVPFVGTLGEEFNSLCDSIFHGDYADFINCLGSDFSQYDEYVVVDRETGDISSFTGENSLDSYLRNMLKDIAKYSIDSNDDFGEHDIEVILDSIDR